MVGPRVELEAAGDVQPCAYCDGPMAPGEASCWWCGRRRWRAPIAGPGAAGAFRGAMLMPAAWWRARRAGRARGGAP